VSSSTDFCRVGAIVVAAILAGWTGYDGGRALIVGDYSTPQSGPRRGQLGPWASIVRKVGIEPRSTGMKTIFLATSALWLSVALALALRTSFSVGWAVAVSIVTLWYVPFGTIGCILVLAASACMSWR